MINLHAVSTRDFHSFATRFSPKIFVQTMRTKMEGNDRSDNEQIFNNKIRIEFVTFEQKYSKTRLK